MATPAQSIANRSNAQSSTGPRTTAGIEACKHNATKHGLTGKQIVIRGEDAEAYDTLRAQLIADHDPANELEAMLVEQIAQNWWRLERARRIESKMFDLYGDVEAYEHKGFLNLQRQLARVERAWDKAVRDLARLQAIRREAETDAQPLVRGQSSSHRSPKIGSVLSIENPGAATAAAPAD